MSKRYARSPSPSEAGPSPFAHLHIQAHEANLIRNHDHLAQSVEYSPQTGSTSASLDIKGKGKTRMIRWVPQDNAAWPEEDSLVVLGGKAPSPSTQQQEYWVDRFDILNLLTALPSPPSGPPSPALSAGFSELGSDHEEMFFFDQQVREEIINRKKRRRLEDSREERMRRLEEEDRAAKGVDDDDGDEPSATQLALMTKLAGTLAASPDPAMLELRILANHGSDPRFAFLRKDGKWSDHWAELRAPKPEAPPSDAEPPEPAGGGLGLVAYRSDSEAESEDGAEVEAEETVLQPPIAGTPSGAVDVGAEDDVGEEKRLRKEAKAEKARAWAAKRKQAREAAEAGTD